MKLTKKIIIQSRNWCFTDFEELDYNSIYNEYKDIIRYIGWGEEICPKTKKTHYQGWVQFVNKKRMNGVKKVFGTHKLHIESCKGNEIQNTNYCAKDKKYKFIGKYIVQGQRTNMEEIKKDLDNGATIKNIADSHFSDYIRYHSGFEKYKKLCDKERTRKFRKLNIELVCGPTGTNKTRKAVENNENAFKIEGLNLKWFDGYNMEKTLIIDEYNNDVPITKMLNLLDGYQLRLEIKGSFTYANWTKVIITTNLRPSEIHAQAKQEHVNALYRRINKITNLYETVPK